MTEATNIYFDGSISGGHRYYEEIRDHRDQMIPIEGCKGEKKQTNPVGCSLHASEKVPVQFAARPVTLPAQ
jgi:hypothetical protein